MTEQVAVSGYHGNLTHSLTLSGSPTGSTPVGALLHTSRQISMLSINPKGGGGGGGGGVRPRSSLPAKQRVCTMQLAYAPSPVYYVVQEGGKEGESKKSVEVFPSGFWGPACVPSTERCVHG